MGLCPNCTAAGEITQCLGVPGVNYPLSVGSQSGAGQELGFRAAPVVKNRFSVNLIIGAVALIKAESVWTLNSKNNCC